MTDLTKDKIELLRRLYAQAKKAEEAETEARKTYEAGPAFAEPARTAYFSAGEVRAEFYQALYTVIDDAIPALLDEHDRAETLLGQVDEWQTRAKVAEQDAAALRVVIAQEHVHIELVIARGYCAFCGWDYGPSVLTDADAAAAHVAACPNHPMRALEAQLAEAQLEITGRASAMGTLLDAERKNSVTALRERDAARGLLQQARLWLGTIKIKPHTTLGELIIEIDASLRPTTTADGGEGSAS